MAKSIRLRTRRNKKGAFDLELNSLLDVLVIILVFLIKNYSATQSDFEYKNNINVPLSSSINIAKRGVIIQVDKEFNLYVEQKLITNLKQDARSGDFSKVVDEMTLRKQEIDNEKKTSAEKIELNSNIVNMVMDQELTYEYVQKIMQISLDVGFEEFKFIVIES